MLLQNQMISIINDNFGNIFNSYNGRKSIIKRLQRCAKSAPEQDKQKFYIWINYINLLYDTEVPVLEHSITYRKESLETIDTFERILKHIKCKSLLVSIEVIETKLKATDNVRRLSS